MSNSNYSSSSFIYLVWAAMNQTRHFFIQSLQNRVEEGVSVLFPNETAVLNLRKYVEGNEIREYFKVNFLANLKAIEKRENINLNLKPFQLTSSLFNGRESDPHPKLAEFAVLLTGVMKQNGSTHVPLPETLQAIFDYGLELFIK